jgi:sulfatase modifying factor 1
VGSYPDGVSPYGVFDLAGNVSEWVNDWFSVSYYSESPAINPPGSEEGTFKVYRGGFWSDHWFYLRDASRVIFTPDTRLDSIGFRCSSSPPEIDNPLLLADAPEPPGILIP